MLARESAGYRNKNIMPDGGPRRQTGRSQWRAGIPPRAEFKLYAAKVTARDNIDAGQRGTEKVVFRSNWFLVIGIGNGESYGSVEVRFIASAH